MVIYKANIDLKKKINNFAIFLFFCDISKTKTEDLRPFAVEGHKY